ncbi:MAG: hypothetical protein RID91_06230 [Azospirillaceae bacterium]
MAELGPRDVHVPMVGARGDGVLARLRLEPRRAAAAPGLLPEIAELDDVALYPAGQAGLGALSALGLTRRPGWLGALTPGQRLPFTTTVVNAAEVTGLGAENSRSAELGLALGMALYQAQARPRGVIATGALELTGAPDGAPRVAPVGGLAAKFDLVARLCRQDGGRAALPDLFFVPALTEDGAPVAEAFAERIDRLATEAGVTVVPVADLAEATAHLGATAIAPGPRRAAARRLGAAAALVLFLAGAASIGHAAWQGLRDAPLDLAFAPVTVEGASLATPARAAADLTVQPPCRAPTDGAAHPVDEWLLVKVRIADPAPLAAWLFDAYHHALVAVSQSGGLKVFTGEALQGRAGAALEFGYRIPIAAPPGDELLLVVARRGRPIDGERLRTALADHLARVPDEERLNAALNRLVARMPGTLAYFFESVEGDAPCRSA